jgi:hypothetical protein
MVELLTPETQTALVKAFNDLLNLGVGVLSAWLAWRATKAKRDINAAHEKIRLIAKADPSAGAVAPASEEGASLADLADVEPDVVDAMLARLELEVRALRIVRTLSRQPIPPPPPPAEDPNSDEHHPDAAA